MEMKIYDVSFPDLSFNITLTVSDANVVLHATYGSADIMCDASLLTAYNDKVSYFWQVNNICRDIEPRLDGQGDLDKDRGYSAGFLHASAVGSLL